MTRPPTQLDPLIEGYLSYLADVRRSPKATVRDVRCTLRGISRLRAQPVKLPVVLTNEEVRKVLASPDRATILGLRDRALILLLYGTGIRASECPTRGGIESLITSSLAEFAALFCGCAAAYIGW